MITQPKLLRYTLTNALLFLVLNVNAFAQTTWQQGLEDVGEFLVKNGLTKSVVIATRDGNAVRILGFGKLGNGQTPNQNTLFEIASITKVFTGAVLARMHIDDQITLDTRLEEIYSETKGKKLGLVTLKELSTHTSGVPSIPENMVPFPDPDNP